MVYVSQGRCVTGTLYGLCVTGPFCHRAVVSQAHCMVCVSQGRCVTGTLYGLCVTGPFCHSAQSLFYRTFVTILVNT